MRFEGPLKPLKGAQIPGRIIVFDTEAYRPGFAARVETQTLRLGIARYTMLDKTATPRKTEVIDFSDIAPFYGFIMTHAARDCTLYIYAHNLKYDLQLTGIIPFMVAKGWKVKTFVIDDPPTFIKMSNGRLSVMFVDTFNYWQFSLAKMGEQLQFPKLKMPDDAAPLAEWVTYCTRDVEVLHTYLLRQMAALIANDLAPFGLTVASQALRTYRHRFMPDGIILHCDPAATALERAAYCGGRVECFRLGQCVKQPYYYLDVNSMYPYVMASQRYPARLWAYSADIPVARLAHLLTQGHVIADVTVRASEPVFPVRMAEKLVFPTGEFRAALHTPELEFALARDWIVTVHRVALYDSRDIFSAYVSYFYRQKEQATAANDPILRQQAKLMLNSLYGKFGQLQHESIVTDNEGAGQYGRMTGYSERLQTRIEVDYLGNTRHISYRSGETAHSFPAIAGAVTAFARMHLWNLISRAGREHVYYVDTDSLIVDHSGLEALTPMLDPARLGALKCEGVESHLLLRGLKDYEFGRLVKIKGVPHSAEQLDPDTYEYEQFRGARTWISQGMPVGVEVYLRQKHRHGAYTKGVPLPDGRVLPFTLTVNS